MKKVNIVSITKMDRKFISYDIETGNSNFFANNILVHNSNMAVCYSQGELWVQSRNHVRTLLGDQNGMAQFVEATREYWIQIITAHTLGYALDLTTHTIVLDCEWAGGNIQKGNAACSGTDKAAYLFDYFRVVDNLDDSFMYLPNGKTNNSEHGIYSMAKFSTYNITLDFNKPKECELLLNELALTIEANSPIAAYFDKPDNVGEGAYLWTTYNGEVLRLKAKGLKHGGKPKVKKTNGHSLSDDAKVEMEILADKLTPGWRLTQAITETEATEQKHIGKVLKWVMQDIIKEEQPTLEAAEVEFKQVQGFVASIVKDFYFDGLREY